MASRRSHASNYERKSRITAASARAGSGGAAHGEAIHQLLRSKDVTTKTFEDEVKEIADEGDALGGGPEDGD